MTQNANVQRADVYQPIMSARPGPPPLVIRVGIVDVPFMSETGPIQSAPRAETYVLLSALPEEIRKRVEVAVQAKLAGR